MKNQLSITGEKKVRNKFSFHFNKCFLFDTDRHTNHSNDSAVQEWFQRLLGEMRA